MSDEAIIRADTDYVLRWLRQIEAPANIIGLQERALAALGRLTADRPPMDELMELLADLAMENLIRGLGDPVAEVNDQTGVLGRVRALLGSDFLSPAAGVSGGIPPSESKADAGGTADAVPVGTAAALATGDESPGALARTLRKAREHQGHTLRYVEEETGVHNAHLSQVERGIIEKPSLDVLIPLAAFYRLNVKLLAEWAGYSPAVVALLAAESAGGTPATAQPSLQDPDPDSFSAALARAEATLRNSALQRRVGRLEEALRGLADRAGQVVAECNGGNPEDGWLWSPALSSLDDLAVAVTVAREALAGVETQQS